jgi:two-component system, OmpR family, response regulator MprA
MDGRLLVVEDDPQVRGMLVRALGYEGFEVSAAPDAASAFAALKVDRPDLVLLDLLLPDLDGMEVCRRLRASGDAVPVLMLTARDGIDDRVDGLEQGADDYVVKPFDTAELVARVRALLRRTRAARERPRRRFADLEVDLESREVRRGERLVGLTRREFDLLALLVEHPRRVMSRERLMTEAWGYRAAIETNAVDVYVGYLRRKLEESGEERLIWTVRGVGFVLREGRG